MAPAQAKALAALGRRVAEIRDRPERGPIRKRVIEAAAELGKSYSVACKLGRGYSVFQGELANVLIRLGMTRFDRIMAARDPASLLDLRVPDPDRPGRTVKAVDLKDKHLHPLIQAMPADERAQKVRGRRFRKLKEMGLTKNMARVLLAAKVSWERAQHHLGGDTTKRDLKGLVKLCGSLGEIIREIRSRARALLRSAK